MNPTISAFLASPDTAEQFFIAHPEDVNEIASMLIGLEDTATGVFAKSSRAPELVRWITRHPELRLEVAFELDEFLSFNPLHALPENDRSFELIFDPAGHMPWEVETTFKALNRPAQLAILRKVRLTPPYKRQSHRMLKLLIICGSVNIPDGQTNQRLLIDHLVAHAKEVIENNGDDDTAMTPHLVEAAFRTIEMVSL